MSIVQLIAPERIACDIEVASKKRVLELLSELAAGGSIELTAPEIFASLLERERLGSTGLGRGVAIPHGRLPQCEHAVGAFAKLKRGIDFDASDGQPVDLLFALLVPKHYTNEHLEILALLAEMFSDAALCEELRAAQSSEQIFRLISDWQTHRAPA